MARPGFVPGPGFFVGAGSGGLRCYDGNVRIRVTLDAETERLLKTAVRERGVSFKTVLNDAVRKGLTPAQPVLPRRFEQKTYDLDTSDDRRWDKALAMADAMEDEEIIRKISLRK